jgi:ABC transport system ATP-binding/permease protein
MRTTPVLLGQNLKVVRASRAILNNISLSICPSEFVVVLGPSGSGKSTLMKVLSGILEPDQGQVTLDSVRLNKIQDRELCQQIGVVPQDDIIHRHLNVEAALNYAARLRFPSDASQEVLEKAIQRVLKLTELEDRRSVKIKRLSGGQRKRVNLGVELLESPRFLFLDEPTSGLDPALEESMMRLFQSLARQGHGILTSTHSMASLDLADLLLIVMDGFLIYYAPPQNAAEHFEVDHYSEIFKAIRTASAAEWAKRFAHSPLSKQSTAMRRLPSMTHPAPPPSSQNTEPQSREKNSQSLKAPANSAEELLASIAAEIEAEGKNKES